MEPGGLSLFEFIKFQVYRVYLYNIYIILKKSGRVSGLLINTINIKRSNDIYTIKELKIFRTQR